MPLSGRVCVVTGAGRGIGRSTAETLASAGARLALCSRSPHELEGVQANLQERFGTEVLVRCVDVADYPGVQGFADAVGERSRYARGAGPRCMTMIPPIAKAVPLHAPGSSSTPRSWSSLKQKRA